MPQKDVREVQISGNNLKNFIYASTCKEREGQLKVAALIHSNGQYHHRNLGAHSVLKNQAFV